MRVQDVVRRYTETHDTWDQFGEKVAFQMNDTHPTLLSEFVGEGGGHPHAAHAHTRTRLS